MKKFLSVLMAIAMLLMLFSGCGGSSTAAKTTNMKTLLHNTAKQLVKESENAYKNLYGFVPDKKEGYAELSVSADNLNYPIEGNFVLNSFAADLAASVSDKDKEMAMTFGGEINGVDINLIEMLWNDSSLNLSSPSLLDKTFNLPVTDFTTKWNNSYLGSVYPINQEIPSLSFSDYFDISNMNEDISKKAFDLTADFLSSSNKSNEETVMPLNGKDTTVTKFTMVVTKDSLKNYLTSLVDTLLEITDNEMYKNLLIAVMGLEGYEYEDAVNELKTELENELNNIGMQDVTFYIYGYDSKIVRVEWEGVVDGSDVLTYLQFNNSDCLLDDVDFVMEVKDSSQGEQGKLVVSMDSDFTTSKDHVYCYVKINLEEDGSVTNLADMKMDFDYTTNKYTISLNGDGSSFEMTGSCTKGNMFEMTIEDLVTGDGYSTVSVQDMVKAYLGNKIGISVKVSPKAENVNLTATSETVNVTDITEDDLTEMQGDLTGNVIKLLSSLGIDMSQLLY